MPELETVKRVEAQNLMLLSRTHGRCKLPDLYGRFT
jgi:hypothetical protein